MYLHVQRNACKRSLESAIVYDYEAITGRASRSKLCIFVEVITVNFSSDITKWTGITLNNNTSSALTNTQDLYLAPHRILK